MLSTKCRDLCLRELSMEADTLSGVVSSRPFKACDCTWEVFFDPPAQPATSVLINLRIISPMRAYNRKLTVQVTRTHGAERE